MGIGLGAGTSAVFLEVKNGGSTPAYDVRFHSGGRIDVPAIPLETVAAIQQNPTASDDSTISLVAGQDTGKSFEINMSDAQEEACQEDTYWLYLAELSTKTSHDTWFCHTFHGNDFTPATYRHGNRAD